jgi:hypothetical protein
MTTSSATDLLSTLANDASLPLVEKPLTRLGELLIEGELKPDAAESDAPKFGRKEYGSLRAGLRGPAR